MGEGLFPLFSAARISGPVQYGEVNFHRVKEIRRIETAA